MKKHIQEINVGYDNSQEAHIPVHRRRALGAAGGVALAATGLALGLSTHGNEGNHSMDGTYVGVHGHKHSQSEGAAEKQTTQKSKTVTYVVKPGENPGSIADKLTDNPSDFNAMVQDIKDQESTPNILPVKQGLELDANEIDPEATQKLQETNSAGH